MHPSKAPRCDAPFSPAAIVDELRRLERVDGDPGVDGAQDIREAARNLTTATDTVYEAMLSRSPEQVRQETGFILRSMVIASTVEEALGEYRAHMDCYWSAACRIEIETRGERVFVALDLRVGAPEERFLHDLRHCSALLSMVNWLCGEVLPETIAHLPAAPIDLEKVRSIFRYGLVRDGAASGISFRRQDMRKPIIRTPNEIEAFVSDMPGAVFLGSRVVESYSRRVSALVARSLRLHRKISTVVEVCDQLGLSAATLHRKLSAENTSFRKLRDSSVNLAAKELIEKTDAGIPTISDMLGYSEEGAFRRSFIRWNGCSPAAYRRQSQRAAG